MRTIIGGKVYNTATMTVIVEKTAYNNGNISGSTTLRVTPSGLYCIVRTSNGQDCYRSAGIEACTVEEIPEFLDGWTPDDTEHVELLKRGILQDA